MFLSLNQNQKNNNYAYKPNNFKSWIYAIAQKKSHFNKMLNIYKISSLLNQHTVDIYATELRISIFGLRIYKC